MPRVWDAETILHNLCFDIERMVREKQEPKVVIGLIEKKLHFLTHERSYEEIRWWNKEEE